ncbi:MAG: 3-hydroxyacyl-CoA dehydrogenase family protein [Synergistaceae bacterium]|nr:3-hydroxyacyl-CoA dehydrogenase family protein [Synergistaceae bacterium]
MKVEDIKKVCVVGAGQMGRQIALNCALYGYETVLYKCTSKDYSQIETWVSEYLQGRVAKEKLTAEQAAAAKGKLFFAMTLSEATDGVQLVIEANLEDKEVKEQFYKDVNACVGEDVILASNSSYIGSSLFMNCVDNPARLANMHYFNPALAMKLVEVIKGEHTAEETITLLMDFAKRTGKTPIRVNKEIDGFVVNRILRAIRDEAFYLIEQGVCSPQDLDTGVELGLNHPMGPFRLLDLTGVDLNYMSGKRRLEETGVKPNGFDIVKEMYEKKEWGRKTGKGFYEYEKK